jgi:hypothetical protein
MGQARERCLKGGWSLANPILISLEEKASNLATPHMMRMTHSESLIKTIE